MEEADARGTEGYAGGEAGARGAGGIPMWAAGVRGTKGNVRGEDGARGARGNAMWAAGMSERRIRAGG